MKMTSAEASKLLRQLTDQLNSLESMEQTTRSYVAATIEDPESVRPEYDYSETQAQIIELENKIRAVKHAIYLFNTQTVIPVFNMTVDSMLVFLPQLSHRKAKLSRMKNVLPKERCGGRTGSTPFIEYRYANYDLEKVKEDYEAVSALLYRAQTALDNVNSTVQFDIDI